MRLSYTLTSLAYSLTSPEPRFSVLDFVSQLWRKLQNGNPDSKAVARPIQRGSGFVD